MTVRPARFFRVDFLLGTCADGIGVVTYPFLSMIALQEQRSRFFESLLAAPEVDAVEPEEG